MFVCDVAVAVVVVVVVIVVVHLLVQLHLMSCHTYSLRIVGLRGSAMVVPLVHFLKVLCLECANKAVYSLIKANRLETSFTFFVIIDIYDDCALHIADSLLPHRTHYTPEPIN